MMEQYEKDKEIERLNKDVARLEELLSTAEEQYSSVEQMVERLQEQLSDASKTIDYYDKKDFHYTLADGTVMGAEPAHKYKVKWGVK